MDDLGQMVRLSNVCYAGASGLEIDAFGACLVHPQARRRADRRARQTPQRSGRALFRGLGGEQGLGTDCTFSGGISWSRPRARVSGAGGPRSAG